MATVTLLQATDMAALPTSVSVATATNFDSLDFVPYGDGVYASALCAGVFPDSSVIGTVSRVFLDDLDFGMFPNLDITAPWLLALLLAIPATAATLEGHVKHASQQSEEHGRRACLAGLSA